MARSGAVRRVALCIAAVSAASSVVASSPGPVGASPRGRDAAELLPDLHPVPPYGIFVEVAPNGHRHLRLSVESGDVGSGPLELFPVAEDCDHDGDATNDRTAYQRVYLDSDGDGVFERGRDTTSTTTKAGCFVFHPSHNHWHFRDYALYELKRLRDGTIVGTGRKVSFCIVDTIHEHPELPGSPAGKFYQSCDADDTEGISVGWGDVYANWLPGQSIPLDGVGDGSYCVVDVADPDGRLRESDDSNNAAGTAIRLSGSNVRVLDTSCS